jgi:hypothetical protein
MPITQPEPPPGVRQAVDTALDQLAGTSGSLVHTLARDRPEALSPTLPHPVFQLGLSDLTERGSVESARLTGWRYLLRQGDEIVATAETVVGRAGEQQFSQVTRGPFAVSTAAALEVAEALPEARERSYELRLLHVPALYAMALWLHDDGKNDRLIPLDPSPEGIESNRPYEADEFLRILGDIAKQVPRMEARDTRGG